MANKVKFTMKSLPDFINRLSDLTKIEDSIKLKIDRNNILVYSMLNSGQIVLAFKNYLLKTDDYLEYKDDDMNVSYDIILPNAKKFVKNIKFLESFDKVEMQLTYKESQDDDNVMDTRAVQIKGGKLKVNWITGEHYQVRDMNKHALEKALNLDNRKWFFDISKDDFSDVKKLSSINSERIININVNNGKVLLSEKSAWELEIGNIDERNANLILNKKFLSCINEMEHIEFSIFDNFMLVKDESNNSNLMLSFEQDFNEDEI
jgi:hypothetical protein